MSGGTESHVAPAGADRLDRFLATWPSIGTRRRAREAVESGKVSIDGRAVSPEEHGLPLPEGVVVAVAWNRPGSSRVVTRAERKLTEVGLRVLYEDADVVVVDKAPGMVVHPGAGHAQGTLVHALLHHVDDLSGVGGEERPGIVHRLDRGTSGLLVVAKHDRAHRALAEQFAEHSAHRTYLALTIGAPDRLTGTIRSELARDPKDRLRFASSETGMGKEAITHWRRLGTGRGLALVACRLETGRTHQIRVHLTEAGWPIAGDPLYRRRFAQPPAWLAPRLAPHRPLLHAWRLAFDHPSDGRRLVLEAPLPPDMADVLADAGIPAPTRDPFDRP